MTERYTLTEIRELTLLARPMLRGQAMAYGRDVKIYLHWTAGHYGQHFKDYHIGIDDKGRYSLATEDFSDTLSQDNAPLSCNLNKQAGNYRDENTHNPVIPLVLSVYAVMSLLQTILLPFQFLLQVNDTRLGVVKTLTDNL